MIPEIFSLGPIPINSFGLMVALALFAGIYRLALSFSRLGINPLLAERYVMAAGISGLIGARIWFIIGHWEMVKGDLIGAIIAQAGFTFYGGFVAGALVLLYLRSRDKVALGSFVDSMGPCLSLGYAIGRVGCQLSGDGDYGASTTSIFGMSYSTGVVPTPPGVLAFPTPLYESAMSLAILALLSRIEVSPGWFAAPGRRFGLYLVCLSIERFLIEFLRINPKQYEGFSEAQIFAIGLTLLGLALTFRPTRASV